MEGDEASRSVGRMEITTVEQQSRAEAEQAAVQVRREVWKWRQKESGGSATITRDKTTQENIPVGPDRRQPLAAAGRQRIQSQV
jgi:transposase